MLNISTPQWLSHWVFYWSYTNTKGNHVDLCNNHGYQRKQSCCVLLYSLWLPREGNKTCMVSYILIVSVEFSQFQGQSLFSWVQLCSPGTSWGGTGMESQTSALLANYSEHTYNNVCTGYPWFFLCWIFFTLLAVHIQLNVWLKLDIYPCTGPWFHV